VRAEATGNKPATFDFLGVTHFLARSRRGKFTVKVKTMKKRLKRSITASEPGASKIAINL